MKNHNEIPCRRNALRVPHSELRTPNSAFRTYRGFTLIELLVVISIIAILAALLLPAIATAKVQAQKRKAAIEAAQIAQAIHSYESEFSKFPVSKALADLASGAGEDLTYGGTFKTPTATFDVKPPTTVTNGVIQNSEIMAVLLDVESWPAFPGVFTINKGHVKNPQKNKYLNATMTTDTNSPGVGPDGVYRDPWGDPYVITIDLNYDEKARDAFYRQKTVSQRTGQAGWFGLSNSKDLTGNSDFFEYNSPVIVWSAGPDKMIDPQKNANTGANKDNILSWRQP